MPVHRSHLADACAQDPDDAVLWELGWPVNDGRDRSYWEAIDNVVRSLQPESLEEELSAMRLLRTALLEWLLADTQDADFEDEIADLLDTDTFTSDEHFQFTDIVH
jgi:hypothetical protein